MEQKLLLTNRVATMGLGERKFTTIQEMLKTLGAIQCQDLLAGKWALGLRIKNSTLEKINHLLTTEKIIRTHVMRPTYHFVLKKDVRWMLELTAPRIRRIMAVQFRRRQVSEELCMKTRESLQGMLEGKKELSYNEIHEQLATEHKIIVDGWQLQLVLLDAELNQLLCSGSNIADQPTYTLFDERIPDKNTLTRQEGLEELVKRFFTGHGPATIQDCARWTGLSMGEVKKGVKEVQEQKNEKITEKDGYLYVNDLIDEKNDLDMHLLPRFDEYINGYKDKSLFLPNYENKQAKELGYNAILDQGQIIGKWTRKLTKKQVTIQCEYFKNIEDSFKETITVKGLDYATFMQKTLV